MSSQNFTGQMSIWDFFDSEIGGGFSQRIAIDKPIRLIELFAG